MTSSGAFDRAGDATTGSDPDPSAVAVGPDCVDTVRLDLARGGALLFVSDLHLRAAQRDDLEPLCRAIASLTAGSALVLGGDVVELWDAPDDTDAVAVLRAHADLVAALRTAGRRGVPVVWVVGNHDARMGCEPASRRGVQELFQCAFAAAADVGFPTGTGVQRVWCEHGHMHDPFNALTGCGTTPLGYHLVRDILPAVRQAMGSWVDDVTLLQSPALAGSFVGSRLLYRRLPRLWPALVATVVALSATRLGWTLAFGQTTVGQLAALIRTLAWAAVLDAVVLGTVAALWARRVARRIGALPIVEAARGRNEAVAVGMRSRHPAHLGLLAGHTHVAALHDVPAGFYANPGASTTVVRSGPARLRAPWIFQRVRQVGWVNVTVRDGAVTAELSCLHRRDATGLSALERLLARPPGAGEPVVAASWPAGPSLRPTDEGTSRTGVVGVRRLATALVALTGVVSLVSALSPPLAERIRVLETLAPLEVSVAANAVTVSASMTLFVLALGLWRGQRRAHRVAVAVLSVAAVGHVVKGFDAAEAAVAGVAALTLIATRDAFTVEAVVADLRRRGAVVAAAATAAAAVAVATLVADGVGVAAAVGQVGAWATFGPTTVATGRGAATLRFMQVAVALVVPSAVAVMAATLLGRRVTPAALTADDVRARVLARGADSLAYFALRDDKRQYLHGDSVVSYAVFGRVALVSPDPIGPPADRTSALDAFAVYAARQGWITAVLAAAPDAAAGYRTTGWHTLYLGDEAIVWFDQLDLDLHGNHYKGLRGAVNRARRDGYQVELVDPATLSTRRRDALAAMAIDSRRGEAERGFSMTLGRLFDPRDEGLLLAVAYADGRPGAFCQFVPAADAGGWSLDVMRRRHDTPNGLMDYLLIETMRQLRDRGCTGLGLNFATMRAVVDDDADRASGPTVVMQRRMLHALSSTFQIESLLVFDRKFDPQWRARYLAYRSPAHLPEVAAAVARAESFWEIPIVGRLLTPTDRDVTRSPRAAAP